MSRSYMPKEWGDFILTKEYWCSGTKATAAEYVEISPIKTLYQNERGQKKKRELTLGKLYKGVRVNHCDLANSFFCYAIRNDFGIITQYYEKSLFVDKDVLRNRKLNEIL